MLLLKRLAPSRGENQQKMQAKWPSQYSMAKIYYTGAPGYTWAVGNPGVSNTVQWKNIGFTSVTFAYRVIRRKVVRCHALRMYTLWFRIVRVWWGPEYIAAGKCKQENFHCTKICIIQLTLAINDPTNNHKLFRAITNSYLLTFVLGGSFLFCWEIISRFPTSSLSAGDR